MYKFTIKSLLITLSIFVFNGIHLDAQAVNLISNPSMETVGTGGNPANWFRGGYGTNTRTFSYPTVGVDGNKAARVQISNYTSGDAKWFFSDVSVTGGTAYTFSHSYKSNVPTKLGVRYQTSSGEVHQLLTNLPASLNWNTQTRTINVPNNATKLTVFHIISRVGYLETDAFFLSNGTLPPPPPDPIPGVNLISNPTFETVIAGKVAGWFTDNSGGQNVGINGPITPCVTYYTYADLLRTSEESGNYYDTVHRPYCPNNAKIILNIGSSTDVYFSEVQTGTKKNFRFSYQYQNWTRVNTAQLVARFKLSNGTFAYSNVNTLQNLRPGGSGYVNWIYAEHDIVVPNDAVSLTLIFRVNEDLFRGLNIANPLLRLKDVSESPAVGADLISPVISITSPVASSTVSGTINVSISATDNVSMGSVRLYVDDVPAGNPENTIDSTNPYSISLNTNSLSDGFHILTVRGVDQWGRNYGEKSLAINVLNTVIPPPPPTNNLIQNGNLETLGTGGNPQNWGRGGWGTNTRVFTYPTIGQDGNKAAKVQITSFSSGDAKWFFNDVPVTGGKTYTFQSSYKSNIPSELSIKYQTTTGAQYQSLVHLPVSTNWTNVTRQINVPANATAITVYHIISAVGVLETDNFSLISDTATTTTGSLTVSIDPSTPNYALASGGSTNVNAGVVKLRAINENINLTKLALKLTAGSPSDLIQVSLWNGSTQIGTAVFTGSNTTATSTLLSPLLLTNNVDVIITIKADFAQIGTSQPGIQASIVKIDPLNAEGIGALSGSIIRTNSITPGVSGVRIFKSYPTVALDTLSSSGMADGKLMRFKITANYNGSVGLNKFKFHIATSSLSGGGFVSGVKLYAYTDSAYSTPVSGLYGDSMGQFGATASINSENTYTMIAQNPLQVPAGTTMYFELNATVAEVHSNTSVTTTLLGDPSYNGLFNAPNVSGNFVWSGNATSTSTFGATDWSNGFGVFNLPATGILQVRSN